MTRVLLIYQKLIPSAILCGHAQLNYLSEAGKIEYTHSEIFWVTAEMISASDVIVIIRGAMELDLLIAETAKKLGKRLVYVLDDDLFNVPKHIESAQFYWSMVTRFIMRKTMSLCDCFASPSEKLIEKYGAGFAETALIEEPALNEPVLNEPPEATNENKPVKICFAGSLDRTKDLEIILKESLTKLLQTFGKAVDITFFGAKPSFVDELKLRYIPYCMDYNDYSATMNRERFDIGLSPIVPTEFSVYKHYNKYIEYASYGAVGIFSNVYPYTRAIKNLENGILCDNTSDAWYQSIKMLLDNPALLSKIKTNCILEAKTKYSLDTVSEDYYNKVCACGSNTNRTWRNGFRIKRKLFRMAYFFARCCWSLKRRLTALFAGAFGKHK